MTDQERLQKIVDETQRAIVYERDELDHDYFERPLLVSEMQALVSAAQRLLAIGKLRDDFKDITNDSVNFRVFRDRLERIVGCP